MIHLVHIIPLFLMLIHFSIMLIWMKSLDIIKRIKNKIKFTSPYLTFHYLSKSEIHKKKYKIRETHKKIILSLSNKLTLKEGRNGEWKRRVVHWFHLMRYFSQLISFHTLSNKTIPLCIPMKCFWIDQLSCVPYIKLCYAFIWFKTSLGEGQRKLPPSRI